MVTTAMGSPVVAETLTDVPDLRQVGPGACSCCLQLMRPAGAGSPDAHTPVRSAPTPMDLELVGTEDRRPRVVRDRGASRARSASVRSQSGWTAPHIVGQRLPARRITVAPSPERGPSVDRTGIRCHQASTSGCPGRSSTGGTSAARPASRTGRGSADASRSRSRRPRRGPRLSSSA